MKTIVTAMAVLLAFGSAVSTAGAQQYPAYGNQYGTWNQNGNGGQCNAYSQHRHHDRDNDNDNDKDDRGNRNGNYNNNGYYGNNGYYNTTNPYYGNNSNYNNGYNNNPNGNRYYAGNNRCADSNASVRGSIVGVSGNQVILQTQNNRTITIDDQPALDRQASGRVAVGRYVTAYGYWSNGLFYATQFV